MVQPRIGRIILIAEDDPDDRLLLREALEETCQACQLYFFGDGSELLDFLDGQAYENLKGKSSIHPDLIILDLNMPRIDGRAALAQIKQMPQVRRTPVVILTTSNADSDVTTALDLGASSFLVKPTTFSALRRQMQLVTEYWFSVVRQPIVPYTDRGAFNHPESADYG